MSPMIFLVEIKNWVTSSLILNRGVKRVLKKEINLDPLRILKLALFYRQNSCELSFPVLGSLPETQATHSTMSTQTPGTLPGCYRRLLPHLSRYVNGQSRVFFPSFSPCYPFFSHLYPSFTLQFPPTTLFSVQTLKRKCVNSLRVVFNTLFTSSATSSFFQTEQKWMNDLVFSLLETCWGILFPPRWYTIQIYLLLQQFVRWGEHMWESKEKIFRLGRNLRCFLSMFITLQLNGRHRDRQGRMSADLMSQLIWLGHLIRIPSVHLPLDVLQACP